MSEPPTSGGFAPAAAAYIDAKASSQFLPASRFPDSEVVFRRTGVSIWIKQPKYPEYADGIKMLFAVADGPKTAFIAYCDVDPVLGLATLAQLAWQSEQGSRFGVLHSVRFEGDSRLLDLGIAGFVLFSPQTLAYTRKVSPRPRLLPGANVYFAVPVSADEYQLFRRSSAELMASFERVDRDLMTWRLGSPA